MAGGWVEPTREVSWLDVIALSGTLIPFGLAIAFIFTSNGISHPMFSSPPDILGIPLGVVVQILALGWAAIGVATVWRRRGWWPKYVALSVFTIPATALLVFTSALILAIQNLQV